MSECKGGSTVAGATVARVRQLVTLTKARVVVVGGGPAGARVAGILAGEGARVRLTAFDEEEAEERAGSWPTPSRKRSRPWYGRRASRSRRWSGMPGS